MSLDGGRGEAHLLQKRLLSGFLDRHLGHSIPILAGSPAKEYQLIQEESIEINWLGSGNEYLGTILE